MIYYKSNSCNPDDLISHLLKCDFNPPLNTYTDITKYATKLIEYAKLFEAWNSQNELIAIVAAYLNDKTKNTAFITNVSCVTDYQRQGITGKLLGECIETIFKLGFRTIQLEVFENNIKAIKLYEKYHFKIKEKRKNKLVMTLENKEAIKCLNGIN